MLTCISRLTVSLLVDHSSIGVDMSGNNNNFHDQNFGVGNSSQIWSQFNTARYTFILDGVWVLPVLLLMETTS